MNKPKITAESIKNFCIGYGTALLLVLSALGITLFIWTFIKSMASPLFLLAIVIVAWKHGMRAGIFATLISGVLIDYFFVTPEYQLSGSTDDVLRLFIFAVEGYALCWLVNWRTNAAEEIKFSKEQLQALSLRQNALREEERKKIALEIHDELGQSLTGLKMELHLLKERLKNRQFENPEKETILKLEDLMLLVDGTVQTVRRIATELRPPILDDLGLVAALEWQTQEFQRRTAITCLFSANIDHIELNNETSTAVFRIFQETLTNIIRHAEARTVSVLLKKIDEKLFLRVEDDGIGIKPENINNSLSMGILGMKERARIIGGELEIFNESESGTTVLLSFLTRAEILNV